MTILEALHLVKSIVRQARFEARFRGMLHPLPELDPGPPARPPLRLRPQAEPGTGLVYGLPAVGDITSVFGPRRHPIRGRVIPHAGIDIAGPAGTPVFATGAAIVQFAGPRGGYGNLVVLDHGHGIQTFYGHLRDIYVRTGEEIAERTVIGAMGSTGYATGSHVHYERRQHGVPVDPLP